MRTGDSPMPDNLYALATRETYIIPACLTQPHRQETFAAVWPSTGAPRSSLRSQPREAKIRSPLPSSSQNRQTLPSPVGLLSSLTLR
jgi:hypothetical protein